MLFCLQPVSFFRVSGKRRRSFSVRQRNASSKTMAPPMLTDVNISRTYIYCHFTTNFLLFVIYTPGFSPSSDSPLERTFLPVRS